MLLRSAAGISDAFSYMKTNYEENLHPHFHFLIIFLVCENTVSFI